MSVPHYSASCRIGFAAFGTCKILHLCLGGFVHETATFITVMIISFQNIVILFQIPAGNIRDIPPFLQGFYPIPVFRNAFRIIRCVKSYVCSGLSPVAGSADIYYFFRIDGRIRCLLKQNHPFRAVGTFRNLIKLPAINPWIHHPYARENGVFVTAFFAFVAISRSHALLHPPIIFPDLLRHLCLLSNLSGSLLSMPIPHFLS